MNTTDTKCDGESCPINIDVQETKTPQSTEVGPVSLKVVNPSWTNLFGERLLTKDGEQPTSEVLAGKDRIAIYFSAHWCPPCRDFTPKLSKQYNKLQSEMKSFEVIFVSGDKNHKAFQSYFQEMPWCAVPFDAKVIKSKLSEKYSVGGIPTLILLDKDGNVITKQGRQIVMQGLYPWDTMTLQRQSTSEILEKTKANARLASRQGVFGNLTLLLVFFICGVYFQDKECSKDLYLWLLALGMSHCVLLLICLAKGLNSNEQLATAKATAATSDMLVRNFEDNQNKSKAFKKVFNEQLSTSSKLFENMRQLAFPGYFCIAAWGQVWFWLTPPDQCDETLYTFCFVLVIIQLVFLGCTSCCVACCAPIMWWAQKKQTAAMKEKQAIDAAKEQEEEAKIARDAAREEELEATTAKLKAVQAQLTIALEDAAKAKEAASAAKEQLEAMAAKLKVAEAKVATQPLNTQ